MAKTKAPPRAWLSYAEAAEYLGVPVRTLQRWVFEGRVPFTRLGGYRRARTRFDRAELDAWVESQTHRPGNGDAA